MTFDISSATNERIKRLVRLRERKHREAEGVFLVEGRRLLDRAILAGLTPIEIYSDGSIPWDGQTVKVQPDVLAKASYRGRSEGLIALFAQYETTLDQIQPSPDTLLLVSETLEKPGNLGAVLRTAEAVGADGVVSVDGAVDRFNPNVLRASTGACFNVATIDADLLSLIAWLKTSGIALIAASPASDTSLWEADLKGPVALMVGSEDKGLSKPAIEAASSIVRIPMATDALDSLNTSVALALLAYEAVRQRQAAYGGNDRHES